MSKRIVVIGGGPAGYVAAIRAAQLGAEVHLVERERLGGTCLNVGCIPTKVLLHTADLYHTVLREVQHGLIAENVGINWSALQKHKDAIVKRLVDGVEGLLNSNKVIVHRGCAVLQDKSTVRIEGRETTILTAATIMLAVGSATVQLDIPGSNLPGVIDSTEALSLTKIPTSMVIVGGGVIGIELAALYHALGTKVTVLEMLPQILPSVDGQISALIRSELSKEGIHFFTDSKIIGIAQNEFGLTVNAVVEANELEIPCENVLIAVGRRPNTDDMGLEAVGLQTVRAAITVDQYFATNVPGIYAIGDCNGQIMLAHAASAQGIAAVEHAMGIQSTYKCKIVPSCIYTSPELACVGITEEEAKTQGLSYKVGLFPLAGNGKSRIEGCETGLIKIIADSKYGEILGAHMMGPRVTEIIGEVALAMSLEATVEDIVSTIHAHPTVSEAVAEAAQGVFGSPIHWPPRRYEGMVKFK